MTSNNISSSYDAKPLHKKALFDGASSETIDLLRRCMQNICEIGEVDACTLTLLEPEEPVLFIYSTQQQPAEEPGRISFHTSEELNNWIAQQRATLLDAAREANTPSPTAALSHSIFLTERDSFMGILSVQSSLALDDHKVKILSALADQIAMTIGNMIQTSTERQELERTKTRFFSMLTHDLRAPLNSINGYLDLALSGAEGELNEQQYEFIQRARMGSEHLYALLENLLVISRADNGQLKLNREIVNLQDVIDNAIEDLELSQQDQDVLLGIDTSKARPRIYVDPLRLQQVLRNLLANALNFTLPGGEVIIRTQLADDTKGMRKIHERQGDEKMGTLKLQVCDTGVGIAPEYQTRVFERYFQVPNEQIGRAGGPGLGLAVAKMIVELHGGSIIVESSPGEGSTFTCILPCVL